MIEARESNTVGVFLPPPDDGNRSSSRNVFLAFRIPDGEQSPDPQQIWLDCLAETLSNGQKATDISKNGER
jgi:hypothetical protein